MNYKIGDVIKLPHFAGERFGLQDWQIDKYYEKGFICSVINSEYTTSTLWGLQLVNKYNKSKDEN